MGGFQKMLALIALGALVFMGVAIGGVAIFSLYKAAFVLSFTHVLMAGLSALMILAAAVPLKSFHLGPQGLEAEIGRQAKAIDGLKTLMDVTATPEQKNVLTALETAAASETGIADVPVSAPVKHSVSTPPSGSGGGGSSVPPEGDAPSGGETPVVESPPLPDTPPPIADVSKPLPPKDLEALVDAGIASIQQVDESTARIVLNPEQQETLWALQSGAPSSPDKEK